MVTVLFFLAFILLFVGTITLIQFPEIATQIYEVIEIAINYIAAASGILWFFVPKTFALIVVGLSLAIEAVVRFLEIFIFGYKHLKQ